PAANAFSAFSLWAKTATRTCLPVPLGNTVEPRTFWSDLRGSTPRRTATSTDSTNLILLLFLRISNASSREYTFPASTWLRIAFILLLDLAIIRLPPHSGPCYELSRQWSAPRHPSLQP